ncbi:MAG TPA: hypothetical protein V6C82_04695 [Chroococcales cyanobacterium]|jgi:hypothetical protein
MVLSFVPGLDRIEGLGGFLGAGHAVGVPDASLGFIRYGGFVLVDLVVLVHGAGDGHEVLGIERTRDVFCHFDLRKKDF